MPNRFEFAPESRATRARFAGLLGWASRAGVLLFLVAGGIIGKAAFEEWPDRPESERLSTFDSDLEGVVERRGLGPWVAAGAAGLALAALLSAAVALSKRPPASRIDALSWSLLALLVGAVAADGGRLRSVAGALAIWLVATVALGAFCLAWRRRRRPEVERLVREGRESIARGEPSRALEAIESALALTADDVEALLAFADAEVALGETGEARRALRTALGAVMVRSFGDAASTARAREIRQALRGFEGPAPVQGPLTGWTSSEVFHSLNPCFEEAARTLEGRFLPGAAQDGVDAVIVGERPGARWVVTGTVPAPASRLARTSVRVAAPVSGAGRLLVKTRRSPAASLASETGGPGSFEAIYEVDLSRWSGADPLAAPEFRALLVDLAARVAWTGGLPRFLRPLFRRIVLVIAPEGWSVSFQWGIDDPEVLVEAVEAALRLASRPLDDSGPTSILGA